MTLQEAIKQIEPEPIKRCLLLMAEYGARHMRIISDIDVETYDYVKAMVNLELADSINNILGLEE